MTEPDLYERIVGAANAIYGQHRNRRAFHAKGTWCEGVFTATPKAARLSRATHLQGAAVPALIRFSNASGKPESHDASRDGRGMSVKLRPPNGDENDILATSAPTFVARTPEDFLELLHCQRPDPESGKPDMEAVGAYFARHPEALPAVQAVVDSEPPASFATLAYYSPHAFKLVGPDGSGTWVRYRWRPGAGEQRLPDDEARARGRNYLSAELAERLRDGPVRFELLFQLAADGDPLDDPTAVWPDDREFLLAGRLEATGTVDDPEEGDHIEVFDPLRIVDGIEPSDDPVLHARPKAYSVSAYARLQ